jgi:hypothetical protein
MVKLNSGKNATPSNNSSNNFIRSLEPFDWYQVYAGIKDVITQYINKTDKILNIGAGNSSKLIKQIP